MTLAHVVVTTIPTDSLHTHTAKTRTIKAHKHFFSLFTIGSFYILKPTINKTGISQLAMKWIKTQAYCLQFWYIIPEKSDSSLEIAIETPSKRASLWNMRSSTSGEWSFGQVEIPRNSTGQVSHPRYIHKSSFFSNGFL